ncbi:2-succinyl-6-hydroxy-2,4-cyclohexadiene-1-carboxylate synthase [Edaphobacillus lindanitolerans]|uniref:Putative 2-succinyl-6-hydroxy-2,4-cyclohexadiene-1-carboxylate synthase n=1 Tax=Edaphobacillus lindanitolerans TaxID=550447 RepID=A0A1U7PR74_9BACI|nr:2-succinyl-6-hydroxy-2,4-cyclohexadiene-1-carboxylate synthase [Edaphobacillus lindanitolerans]SIT85811.1 2-succinyl-6-hydroxy-2,4-cyclohexadiene-1-carboxylate synthase [Edaphobacillus lindanitolerans]
MEQLTGQIRGIRVGWSEGGDPEGGPLVLLHGFTGSSDVWGSFEQVLGGCRLIMPDLTGHGRTDSPADPGRYGMEEQIADLDALFDAIGLDRFSLLGYSMGGRVAIGYAAARQERVRRLILESTSPGLLLEEERQKRRDSDKNLAAFILREGIPAFTDYWEGIPLFESQLGLPAARRREVREGRLCNRPEGLAGSLLGIGTGSQPSYWEELHGLSMPVTLITGSLDGKYAAIASRMLKALPDARHAEVEGAGHAVHVENPERFATIVKEAINEGGQP